MKVILDLIKVIPLQMQVAIACLVIGGVAFAGLETRYMTVSDFTKSYILDLKREIRELEKELADPGLPPRVQEMLFEQLELMIDELCYEVPDDPYCKDD